MKSIPRKVITVTKGSRGFFFWDDAREHLMPEEKPYPTIASALRVASKFGYTYYRYEGRTMLIRKELRTAPVTKRDRRKDIRRKQSDTTASYLRWLEDQDYA